MLSTGQENTRKAITMNKQTFLAMTFSELLALCIHENEYCRTSNEYRVSTLHSLHTADLELVVRADNGQPLRIRLVPTQLRKYNTGETYDHSIQLTRRSYPLLR